MTGSSHVSYYCFFFLRGGCLATLSAPLLTPPCTGTFTPVFNVDDEGILVSPFVVFSFDAGVASVGVASLVASVSVAGSSDSLL